jgi:hypothetical protein
MRAVQVLVSVLILIAIGCGALTLHPTAAQEATPAAMNAHPVVGAWVLDNNVDDPANPPEHVVFTADGLYIGVPAQGGNTIGVWAPTGERTAAITLVFFVPGEGGASGGRAIVRATVEVAADGQSFTAPYTLEIVTPDGAGSGQFGPATATGTRLAVEQMGTPAGPLSALFGQAPATPQP